MPDALAHYAISYLVASRVTKPSYALLIALVGLLPDIDVLLRMHRWATHSLVLVALVFFVLVVLLYTKRSYLKYLVLAITLYTLHIVLDIFVAPTPLLWSLTNHSYMLEIEVNGTVAVDGIGMTPQVNVVVEQVDFTSRPVIEGPIVSSIG